MIELAVISGSGFYDFPGLESQKNMAIETKHGKVLMTTGIIQGKRLAFLARHGENHRFLPNKINYKANLLALKEVETKAILATTVCGILDSDIPLAKLAVFDDLYFPDNRLPNGEACTIYDEIGEKGRGHFLFSQPFCAQMQEQIIQAANEPIRQGIYAHVNGPRFNSKPEIKFLQNYASFISQTAGPEVVLAGELEIPFALVGFGVDYANGVKSEPTPVEVLTENMRKSKDVFLELIRKLLVTYAAPKFEGFIYRFD